MPRVAIPQLVVLAALAIGCESPAAPSTPPANPSGEVEGQMFLRPDGRVDLDATVKIHVFGSEQSESYSLGGIRLVNGANPSEWIVDGLEDQGPWPAVVRGPHAFATRVVHVRAHAHAPNGANADFRATIVHDAEEVPVGLTTHVVETQYPCDPPDLAPLADALGGASTWSKASPPETVYDVVDLAVDPRGRAYLASHFQTSAWGVRVLARSPGDPNAYFETTGAEAAIAPGDGAGPTLASLEHAAEGATMKITRLDAMLRPVWSHEITDLNDAFVSLAASGGHVLVATRPFGALTVDGVERSEPASVQGTLVLFDEDTGDVVRVVPFDQPMFAVGMGKGGFAVTNFLGALFALDAELQTRWTAQPVTYGRPRRGPSGELWVASQTAAQVYSEDGVLLKEIATPILPESHAGLWTSFAPMRDGSGIVVANEDAVAAFRDDGTSIVQHLPISPVAWCHAVASFTVASGDGGVVVAAQPQMLQPSPQRFVVLADLGL